MSNQVFIFDTTLRDGEQSPGVSLNIQEKLEIARQLARLQVDVIEAGFPVASQGDWEAVRAIAREVQGPVIAALARVSFQDIDRAWEAIQYSRRPRIHTFLATSDIHLRHKLNKTREEVLAMAVAGVRYAKKYTEDVEFSPEDAFRSDLDYLCQVIEAVIDAGATVVNIPDTVGYATPQEFGQFIAAIRTKVSNMHRAVLSVHCHNDLGLAVANSLAAITNGAQQVECAVNGIGERAGNTALEELVMGLYTRQAYFQRQVNINTRELYRTSKLVSALTGMPVQPNKAIVGKNAFAHESGIHQDGVLKERTTYEIMNPELIGLIQNNIVLGKHSGRHAFRERLLHLGFQLREEDLEKAFQRFKDLADRKREVTDQDLEAIVEDEIRQVPEQVVLEAMQVLSSTSQASQATVSLQLYGSLQQSTATGEGPVDAVLRAIDQLTGISGRLTLFSLNAITGGRDAMGEVTIKVDIGGRLFQGRGISTDIIEASARAYLQAVNKAIHEQDQESGIRNQESGDKEQNTENRILELLS